ncbi:hypothetical protein GQ457_01G000090 [Hibiscus cannabinus]
MCCTSLRNLLSNLKLRSIEARMGKRLKGLRHYNLQLGGRIKVKVKDLKPKRIKDYLECKISQMSPALLNLNQPRKSAQAGPVVSCRDIPFVIQLKQIIEAPR